MTLRSLITSALLLFSLGCAATPARAWWDPGWKIRKPLVIDTSAAGVPIADAIGSVPVLVRLHEGNFRFDLCKADGSDIRFVAEDDKTVLPHHLERLDSVLSEALVWVRVPNLKPGVATKLWLYYGNQSDKAGKVDDPKGTYDSDTGLVYHFSERNQPAFDFSGNNNGAQNAGAAVEGAIIAGGLRLDGRSTITVPGSTSLSTPDRGSWTWSAWLRPATLQPAATIFSRREGGNSLTIGLDNGVPYVDVTGPEGHARSGAGAPITAGAWKHLAVIASGSAFSLYLDGEPYASLNATVPGFSGPLTIGGSFAGELDELEFSRVARGAGYIKFLAYSEGPDHSAKLVTVGGDAQNTSWLSHLKEGYVGVIIDSLTVDGWVVIGLLGVMSLISWWVMINKGRVLNRAAKGNEAFLKEWRHVATDLSVLDGGDDPRTMGGRVDGAAHGAMRDSPLYRIYHIGVEEIRHRIAPDEDPSVKVLSARSIQAIRASLDAGLVRETVKMNGGMVLLTIAISGGPFLGLLGTVVGVMITFAAVAMAGDVNVNAIAPGIAAALAATVAGLAVAIPALFGYNYLLTRIKTASNDLHIFIDEFVTKMAEFYSETAIVDDVGGH